MRSGIGVSRLVRGSIPTDVGRITLETSPADVQDEIA
jgi:hypothetical protein